MDKQATPCVALTVPIQAHGATISSLEFHHPDLGSLEGSSLVLQPKQDGAGIKICIGDAIPIIAAMARIPPGSARKIDISDVSSVMQMVWVVLPKSPPTSWRYKTSSRTFTTGRRRCSTSLPALSSCAGTKA